MLPFWMAASSNLNCPYVTVTFCKKKKRNQRCSNLMQKLRKISPILHKTWKNNSFWALLVQKPKSRFFFPIVLLCLILNYMLTNFKEKISKSLWALPNSKKKKKIKTLKDLNIPDLKISTQQERHMSLYSYWWT